MSGSFSKHQLIAVLRPCGRPALTALLLLGILCITPACRRKTAPENPEVWKKIHLNFKKLDENGLAGSFDSKVAVNYEFCIPADAKKWRDVQRLDSTARRYLSPARGRIGCTEKQWLIIGSTHQPNFKQILYQLAALPYVERIEETYWE